MTRHPNHHEKLDCHSERELQMEALVATWRARRNARFGAVDPLPEIARIPARRWLSTQRLLARQWLAQKAAEHTRIARLVRRSNLRVIAGGRP